MREFQHSRAIRAISTIVLCTFFWVFGGAFEIAQAVSNSRQSEVSSKQTKEQKSSAINHQLSANKPEDKFQKTIEEIEKILGDQQSAASDQQKTNENKEKLKTKKSEIENLDVEIKRQFKETEGKIKGLPEVIKQRHRDFTAKYEANLKELRDNLDDIQKHGAESKELSEAITKTSKFLEKVRPPKRHQKLDPNKLPHRSAEPFFIEPRTSPEQFTEGKELRAKSREQKPILLASNGSIAGLLSSTYEPSANSYQLALADPPTSADLAETIEVQFTPEIQAKAAELGHNPVKIYNWVRNNIEYVPTYGSIQGANMCLQTKQCNDIDTASLLIALLRTSGIHAKYVYGTIELPIEKVKNWAGGFTDSMEALP